MFPYVLLIITSILWNQSLKGHDWQRWIGYLITLAHTRAYSCVAKILFVKLLIPLNSTDNKELQSQTFLSTFEITAIQITSLYLRSPFSFHIFYILIYTVFTFVFFIPLSWFPLLCLITEHWKYTLKHIFPHNIYETQQMHLYNLICNYFELRILKENYILSL